MKRAALYLMAVFYIVAGLNHFRDPVFYLPMMPPWIPAHETMILLSGVAEVALGIALLFVKTRRLAAWGIIAMLIVFLPVHIYMYQFRETTFAHLPAIALLLRFPLQLIFIGWAYIYARKPQL